MSTPEAKVRLAEWFRQWRQPLRKFLFTRGARPADLDDVAQEVFVRLMRYDCAQLVEHPQAYLYKMAANVAAEWSIRARHTKPHEAGWLTGLTADDRPEENTARDAAQDKVERALNRLTPREREILKLQFSEGLGYAAIAVRVGMSHRTVKRLVTRSYQKLRHELSTDLLGDIANGRE